MDSDIYCAAELPCNKCRSTGSLSKILLSGSKVVFGYIEHSFRNPGVSVTVFDCK